MKLSDTYATEQSNVGAGNSVAASAYALQQAYKTLNNNKVNNSILDLNTENTSDTWVPVIKDGKLQHRVIPTTYNTLYPILSGINVRWGSQDAYFTEWENGVMALVNNVYQTCHIHSKEVQIKSYGTGSNWAPILAQSFLVQSSIKTKENIKDIPDQDGLNVLKLRPVSYDYKKNFGEKNQYGLIAEEVLKIFPSAVHVPDDYLETEFDVSKGTDQPIISLDYSKLIPFIIKEIQLQDKRISKLEN